MKTVILAPTMKYNCLRYMESLFHALLVRSDASFLHCWPCMTSFMTSLGSYEFFVNNSRSNWARGSKRSPMDSGRPAESNDMLHDLLRPTSWSGGSDLTLTRGQHLKFTSAEEKVYLPFHASEQGEHNDAKIAALRHFFREVINQKRIRTLGHLTWPQRSQVNLRP